MVDLSRRGFLGGLGAGLIAAPAIVRAASLMPVKALEDQVGFSNVVSGAWTDYSGTFNVPTIRRAFLPRFYVHQYFQLPLPNMDNLEGNEDEQGDLEQLD